ncbi:glycosyltransferase [Oceanobacillus sp. CFH 90083]|uniref:glycosyltransferase family 2 protein n=1 Tax=Oceanobacillus sp. CFH 90083 TaxID=2592336 RepID=UPI00128DBFDB|nr:glycosyltransferase [Oceanobacillus sp. CFH 90083]
MKDITAILADYSDPAAIRKALVSLEKIKFRLHSIIVLHAQDMSLNRRQENSSFKHIQWIPLKDNDLGKTLNDIMHTIGSSYVLFLHGTDYLSPSIQADSLHLSQSEPFLNTVDRNRNITVHRPLLVSAAFLKKQRFLSTFQLPFKEALFPAWLSNHMNSKTLNRNDLVVQSRRNRSANTIEKQKFMQKYQLTKIQTTHPSLSIFISNYNMEKYVETAVASCLLQNEQPEQVLIIDDGSTDNSYHQLQSWNDRKPVSLFSKKNEGKAIALNQLLAHVTSDFILELDADDWLDPDAVSVIKKYLADLTKDVSVLYGNLRKWKQLEGDVLFKGITKGSMIHGRADLLSYPFPLGPRIYRTLSLKKVGGFPVIPLNDGRLYEDVSVLNQLIRSNRFQYHDFTVYNVREHKESITKTNRPDWNEFLKSLK